MEAHSQIPESNLLEIQFYDNGYNQFAEGLANLKFMGLVLFCIGLALTLAVIILFLHFYIIKQRKRTAVERALGMTRRNCAASLIIGIMLLTVLGSIAGCVTGTSISSIVQDNILSDEDYFSTTYS